MGLFTDSLKVSSGLTLGHVATKIGIQKTLTAAEEHAENKVKNYQAKFFDPIIRDDLCHLEVDGQLENRVYPFPTKVSVVNISDVQNDFQNLTKEFSIEKLISFVKVHPWIALFVVLILSVPFGWSDLGSIIGLAVFIIVVRLIFARPKKFQKVLLEDARQYWKIREYVRNALSMGELTQQESLKKLLNARLVQRFPDTIEEIEAHAFNYKHGLNK
ncbi:hypothetical protein STRDD10_00916 [Streptococcus sp. DD10]|uniref:hypothetical protein n=1 Tax=Streptococcus sp. DD10 TaxID=1777878 RepID=UPI000791B3A6|nr:hypothetical protein [Streptococcus sp. DD10]KXT74457.1 hypothetical protein STRDD10_00916 [Streptococcus sp. DD10]